MHYGRWQVSLAILVATLTAKIAYALVYGFATHITVKTKNEHQYIKQFFHNLKILCFLCCSARALHLKGRAINPFRGWGRLGSRLGSCLALKGSSR